MFLFFYFFQKYGKLTFRFLSDLFCEFAYCDHEFIHHNYTFQLAVKMYYPFSSSTFVSYCSTDCCFFATFTFLVYSLLISLKSVCNSLDLAPLRLSDSNSSCESDVDLTLSIDGLESKLV